MEKAKVVMYWSRLPQFGSSHQFESYTQAEASHDSCEDWTELIFSAEASVDGCEDRLELIFSKDQRVNHFFPLCFFLRLTRNTFDFSCYHLMKSCGFLHGCISRRAKFCESISQVFQLASTALVRSISQKSRHCLVLSPFSSPDSI